MWFYVSIWKKNMFQKKNLWESWNINCLHYKLEIFGRSECLIKMIYVFSNEFWIINFNFFLIIHELLRELQSSCWSISSNFEEYKLFLDTGPWGKEYKSTFDQTQKFSLRFWLSLTRPVFF